MQDLWSPETEGEHVTAQDYSSEYLAAKIHARAEVLARPTPVPHEPGVYGWWFRELPTDMDVSGCFSRDGLTLLYAGISPKAPPRNGRGPSKEALRSRIRTHYTGNAEGSTLRRSLGCLLSDRLNIELRRYGSGTRLHFGLGETNLSRWMDRNACVSWLTMPQPWLFEEQILGRLDLPLNLDNNHSNTFHPILTAVRADAARRARILPVLPNPGTGGTRID